MACLSQRVFTFLNGFAHRSFATLGAGLLGGSWLASYLVRHHWTCTRGGLFGAGREVCAWTLRG